MGVEVNALMSICTYCYIKIVILSTISVQGRIEQLMVCGTHHFRMILLSCLQFPALFFKKSLRPVFFFLVPLCMSPCEVTSGCKSKIFHETNMEKQQGIFIKSIISNSFGPVILFLSLLCEFSNFLWNSYLIALHWLPDIDREKCVRRQIQPCQDLWSYTPDIIFSICLSPSLLVEKRGFTLTTDSVYHQKQNKKINRQCFLTAYCVDYFLLSAIV